MLGNNARLFINDVQLTGPAFPLLPFAQDFALAKSGSENDRYLECETIYHYMTIAAGGSNLDLRQWFAVPVPAKLVRSCLADQKGELHVRIEAAGPAGGSIFGAYTRPHEMIRIPSLTMSSWEKAFYAVENPSGLSDCRYDDRITIARAVHNGEAAPHMVREPNIRLLVGPSFDGDQMASAAGHPGSQPDQFIIATIKGHVADPSCKPGRMKNLPLEFNLLVESTDERGCHYTYRSPWVPASVLCSACGRTFSFSCPVEKQIMPGQIRRFTVVVRNGGVAAGKDFFGVTGPNSACEAGSRQARVEDLAIDLSSLRENPIGRGCAIF